MHPVSYSPLHTSFAAQTRKVRELSGANTPGGKGRVILPTHPEKQGKTTS